MIQIKKLKKLTSKKIFSSVKNFNGLNQKESNIEIKKEK